MTEQEATRPFVDLTEAALAWADAEQELNCAINDHEAAYQLYPVNDVDARARKQHGIHEAAARCQVLMEKKERALQTLLNAARNAFRNNTTGKVERDNFVHRDAHLSRKEKEEDPRGWRPYIGARVVRNLYFVDVDPKLADEVGVVVENQGGNRCWVVHWKNRKLAAEAIGYSDSELKPAPE